MFYIGLDISTKCGFAVVNPSGDLKELRIVQRKNLVGIRRAMGVAYDVGEGIGPYLHTRIAIEGYGFATQRLAQLVEVGTLVRARLIQLSVPYIEVPPTQLKKFTTGKGNAKKEDMMLAVYKRWGVEGTNDEVDAYGLAQFARAVDGYDCGLPKVNLDAVTAWKSKHKAPWVSQERHREGVDNGRFASV